MFGPGLVSLCCPHWTEQFCPQIECAQDVHVIMVTHMMKITSFYEVFIEISRTNNSRESDDGPIE